jgi:hypothetical protein
LVLSHNDNDSDIKKRNKVVDKNGAGGFKLQLIKEYRARAAMCRAHAVADPRNRDVWLAEERSWLRKADQEITYHFKECNITNLSGAAHSQSASNTNDMPWKPTAAA